MPDSPALDLIAYFTRIGYTGPREPTLAVLRALQLRHMMAVPFEDLDVLLGRRINIEPAAIQRKIIEQRRGGYCFEQNSLFRDVLRALGFAVTPLLARVRWQVPADFRTPLTHMVLRVETEGTLLVGGCRSGRSRCHRPARTRHRGRTAHPTRTAPAIEPARRNHASGMRSGADWRDIFEFTLTEPAPMDFELGNWYSCTHPKAIFIDNLVVTLTEQDRRVIIYNCDFTYRLSRWPGGNA